MPVVIIERRRVSLTRSAVVHHDKLPSTPRDWRMIDLIANRASKVTVTSAAIAAPSTTVAK
jgi:hypothetical protein